MGGILKIKSDELQKNRKDDARADGKAKGAFGAKAVLLGSLMAAGCQPNVTINNIPYDPTATDSGADTDAMCIATCEPVSGILREEGSTAGPNTLPVGGATLKFNGLVAVGTTQGANLELDGCAGEMPSDSIAPGATTTLTLDNGESAEVRVVEISYDSAGLRLRVAVTPVCEQADAGLDAAGGEGGAGGAGGSDGGDAGNGGSG